MNTASSHARRLSVALAVVGVALAMFSSAGATPPPPPPISGGAHPWIVTLCKFTDLSTEPSTYTPSYFQQLFAGTGSSSVDLVDWWREISYSNIDVSGSKVTTQWYSLGMTRYQWAALNRYNKIRTCGDSAAGDANVGNDYSKYYGVIAIFNDDSAPRTAQTTITDNPLSAGSTTINVASSAGFPAPPFGVTINDGTANDLEEVLVTSVGGGTNWTVTRGYENFNPANQHNMGAAVNLIDGGDLGAADIGTHGITINGKGYTLGLVVLPPQTNVGAAAHETGHGFGWDHSRALSTPTQDYQDCYDMMSFDVCRNNSSSLYTFQGDFGAAGVLNDPVPGAAGPGMNAVTLALSASFDRLTPAIGISLAVVLLGYVLEILGQDYIKVARAKGLSERVVLGLHALRVACPPILTISGLQLGYLLGGAVFTEEVFGWPGLGRQLVSSVIARDVQVVQGAALFIALSFVIVNLVVDLLNLYLDPRSRPA